MSFFQNTCKPTGFGGKIMVAMMNIGHASVSNWGFNHFEVAKNDNCLDIGCGGGANVKKLLKKSLYGKVIGIDYSEVSVEKSKKVNRVAIENNRCEILQGNVRKLPFEDENFEVVTAFETIYFWPEIVESFKEVRRVMKNNGSFIICNEANGEDPELTEKWTKIIKGMIVYNSNEIQKFLEDAGFRDIKIYKKNNRICVVSKK